MSGLAGANDSVLRVAVQTDGKLLIGGGFLEVHGVSRNLMCPIKRRWYAGPREFLMGGANHEVTAVEVQPSDGKVLVGAAFP